MEAEECAPVHILVEISQLSFAAELEQLHPPHKTAQEIAPL